MGRYIGARYVPIMGGEWDNTNEYEPLTVVQYEGDSYTSKKYVPVGVAITNTTYWVKTADYSQQLASLAQSLQQTDNRVQDIEGNVHDMSVQLNQITDIVMDLDSMFVIDSVSMFKTNVPSGANTRMPEVSMYKEYYKFIGIVGYELTPLCTVTELDWSGSGSNMLTSCSVTNNSGGALDIGLQLRCLYVLNRPTN